MSRDFNVYFCRKDYPTIEVLRGELKRAGGRVAIDDDTNFLVDEGFMPVVLDGKPTGFEVYSREIDEAYRARHRERLRQSNASPDDYLRILEACDFDLNFNCKADEREVTAARLVMTAIATVTRGWFSDPQTGTMVRLAPEST